MSVEAALAHRWSAAEREAAAKVDERADVIGGPDHVHERIATLVEESQADEVIATTNTYDTAERRASYGRLAAAVGLAPKLGAGRSTVTPRRSELTQA
jgi:alkanesulfonate monooxygenase SsuD/methylene tetrahydromethanopterin reductase-like flavin-dependent oxidoreductase (luciferase family)